MELDDWMSRFGPSVLHLAYSRLKDRDEAEDVFQDVFVRAHLARESLRDEEKAKAWLLAVTLNICRDRGRLWLRRREHLVQGEVTDLADRSSDTANTVVKQAANRAVWRAVLSLPPVGRDAVILHYFEDLPISDIATLLGCSQQVVKTRLYRARQRLRDMLAEESGHVDG